MQKNLSIVILAAGKGSRMKSPKAKVLHTISGKPMLYHSIKASLELTDDVIVVVAHQKEAVIASMQAEFDNITFVTQDTENFPGTGGAVMGIAPRYEKVLVLNGDMPLITADALSGFVKSDSTIVMSIFNLDDPSGYGRVVFDKHGVQRIVEQKDATPQELDITYVNAGIYSFNREVLETYIPKLSNDNAQSEYYLTDIIALAKADGINIEPLEVDEEYFKGVNSKIDLAAAEEIMQERIRNKWMTAGVVMQLPKTIYIEESVIFEGECLVENGARVCGNSTIINSHIKAHSVVEDSVMENSDVGPMGHLRPLSNIKDTHIGNFVEVKKSTLDGVKAGHLSYIGDAEIGSGSNIGAGVITCNYDGKKKYKTIIGKNVFVGSDSQIVAPCTIEDDVMVAAGTTVTNDHVKSGVLILSRAKIKIIENFFYKFFNKEKPC
ncbi:MAG: bifunctional UDP-N-acetylglucosamine diphosphorylase/glucosamine-1-phosphate N-acetyltransferase GlmU [Helicobacteraceae bacterium]|jgi:bifunctional UDP-N-acetylglucosamine pyrophosphorylase/glucosamine-1-phosphate N-acetyltransferase|nr:bifunctional UDP-N-acetylglucosamine diphosphorylase/glucosamine-1-phosphate N-acetyltransferase GlmU [Helicobacteraceae bacterium]